jgi:hypothetical protein
VKHLQKLLIIFSLRISFFCVIYKLKEEQMSEVNKNKVPGVSYVFTDCGLELPVLDITHPLFTASIN